MLRRKRREPQPIEERYYEPLCAALPTPYRTPFILAWHSGMRLSEIERLRWEHVDLKKQRLYFPGAKTGEWRSVPLLADTAELLATLPRSKPTDLVFPGFADRTATARAWRHAAVEVGCGHWCCNRCHQELDGMHCSEHGQLTERQARYSGPLFRHTRHTAIRRFINMGIPLPRVMQMTGHKNLPTHMGYDVADESDLDLIRKKYDSVQR